jgi:methionyl aminopeptidase
MRRKNRAVSPNLKSADDIERIREAGKIIAVIFRKIGEMDLSGMATLDLDQFIDKEIRSHKARASFATVPGYDHASCISVNDGVVHGVPSKKKIIAKGDLVKVDIGVVKNGFFADACRSYCVPPILSAAQTLSDTAKKALDLGIAQAYPGKRLGDIGSVIQNYVEQNGFSVVRDYTGHGVGFAVHEEPTILHYGRPGTGVTLREGMVLAIEPMINAGVYGTKLLEDGWTAVTRDGSLSAQWEHTIAVTADGPDILTI